MRLRQRRTAQLLHVRGQPLRCGRALLRYRVLRRQRAVLLAVLRTVRRTRRGRPVSDHRPVPAPPDRLHLRVHRLDPRQSLLLVRGFVLHLWRPVLWLTSLCRWSVPIPRRQLEWRQRHRMHVGRLHLREVPRPRMPRQLPVVRPVRSGAQVYRDYRRHRDLCSGLDLHRVRPPGRQLPTVLPARSNAMPRLHLGLVHTLESAGRWRKGDGLARPQCG